MWLFFKLLFLFYVFSLLKVLQISSFSPIDFLYPAPTLPIKLFPNFLNQF